MSGGDDLKWPTINAHKLKGFTLIEAMLVIAIATTLAGLGTSRYWMMKERAEQRQQVQEVLETFQAARDMARIRLTQVTVSVDSGDILLSPENGESETLSMGNQISEVIVNSEDGTLVFNDFGGTIYAEPIVIDISTNSQHPYVITIFPAIGGMRLTN